MTRGHEAYDYRGERQKAMSRTSLQRGLYAKTLSEIDDMMRPKDTLDAHRGNHDTIFPRKVRGKTPSSLAWSGILKI